MENSTPFIKDYPKHTKGHIKLMHDITDAKDIEAFNKATREYYTAVTNSSPDAEVAEFFKRIDPLDNDRFLSVREADIILNLTGLDNPNELNLAPAKLSHLKYITCVEISYLICMLILKTTNEAFKNASRGASPIDFMYRAAAGGKHITGNERYKKYHETYLVNCQSRNIPGILCPDKIMNIFTNNVDDVYNTPGVDIEEIDQTPDIKPNVNAQNFDIVKKLGTFAVAAVASTALCYGIKYFGEKFIKRDLIPKQYTIPFYCIVALGVTAILMAALSNSPQTQQVQQK